MSDSIHVHRISFNATLRCTLKCKLCCSYAPYYNPVPHYSAETLSDYARRFFELADTVDIFNIGGGEPLLNDSLPDFITFAAQYRHRILKRLEVVTNGTIIPNDNLLRVMRDNGVFVLLDDYGPDRSKNVQAVEDKMKKFGISFDRRRNNDENAYCNGWVDLSSFSETTKNKADAEWLSKNCVQANELRCHPIVDGKIFVCPSYRRCLVLGLIGDNPEEYFDLLDDSIDFPDKKKRLTAFLKRDVFSSCAYCNGWLPDSKRFVPAAEQLP